MRELPGILDQLYDRTQAVALFRNREHLIHTKNLHMRHWAVVVEGRFDESYETSVSTIGEAHHRLAVDPHWLIGSCNFLITALVETIARKLPTRRFDRSASKRKLRLRRAGVGGAAGLGFCSRRLPGSGTARARGRPGAVGVRLRQGDRSRRQCRFLGRNRVADGGTEDDGGG